MAKNPIQAIKEAEEALLRLNSGLDLTNMKLTKTAQLAALSSKGLKGINSPSQLTSKIGDRAKITEQLIALIKEQERLEKRLIATIERNKLVTESTNRELVKQKVNQSVLNKEVKLTATINSQLASAYDKLVAKMTQAANTVRHLIIKKEQLGRLTTKEALQLRNSQLQYDRYRAAVMRADKALGRHQRNVGNYTGSLRKLGMSFRTLISGFGIYGGAALIAQTMISIFNLTKKLQSLSFALKAIASDAHEVARTTAFLNDISNRYGADIITTTERYTKFLAAAKQSNITLKDTENIFRTVTKASGVLGLKTDELTGIYLALEQMLSKGKVTTEELRRQLGERLPGAFGIMAQALNVSVRDLDSMLKKGEVLSSEALPKLAKALEKAYGIEAVTRIDTLVAAQNRLKNSWVEFVASLTGDGGGQGLTTFIDFGAERMSLFSRSLVALRGGWDYLTRSIKIFVKSLAPVGKSLKSLGIDVKAVLKWVRDLWTLFLLPAGFNIAAWFKTLGQTISGVASVVSGLVERLGEFSLIDLSNPITAFARLRAIFGGMGEDFEKGWKAIDKQLADEKAAKEIIARNAVFSRTLALYEEIALLKKQDINLDEEKLRIGAMTTDEMRAYEQELISILGLLKNKKDVDLTAIKAAKDSLAYLEAIVSNLKTQQSNLATTSKEWAIYAEKIRQAEDRVKDFIHNAELADKALNGLDEITTTGTTNQTLLGAAIAGVTEENKEAVGQLNEYIKKQKEAEEAIIATRRELLKGFKANLSEFFDEQQLSGIFDSFIKIGKGGVSNFKRLRKEAASLDKVLEEAGEKGGNEAKFLFNSYTSAAQEGFRFMGNILNEISEQNIARYDNEIEKNKDYYAALLANENLTSQQRDALRDKRDAKERELEKKKRQEQRKQASINKAMSAFDTVINTASAVVEALPNIPLAVAVGVMGAVQLGLILSQPLPAFAEGKNVNDNYEGAAIWGEKKREVKLSKNGNIEFSPKKIANHLTHVKKDDIILPDAEKFISGFSDQELYEQHHKISLMASLANASNKINAKILSDIAQKENVQDKLLKEFNKKQMSFKMNQTINLSDDITFLLRKENTL